MEEVKVDLEDRDYKIKIGNNILKDLGSYLTRLDLGSKVLIITNPTVDKLYGTEVEKNIAKAGFDVKKAIIPDGEKYKNLTTAKKLYDQAVTAGLDRSSSIIALGGGVIGDIAGFIASTFMRGINFIQIPTTLLAQVDSSVGGKVAVNHEQGKNLIGSFYQPQLVIIDTRVLQSLKIRDLKAGLSEVIKYGIIWDETLFSFLERKQKQILQLDNEAIIYIIKRSCQIKAEIVAQDEREKNLRMILNYGHTIGHALEVVTDYQKYRHGEAIAIGIVTTAKLAYELNLLSLVDLKRQEKIISNFKLPIKFSGINIKEILAALKKDKKVQDGIIRFILTTKIGEVVIKSNIDYNIIRNIIFEQQLGG